MEVKRVPLRKISEMTSAEIKRMRKLAAVRLWPVFMIYGLSIVFLLKVSQLVLQ